MKKLMIALALMTSTMFVVAEDLDLTEFDKIDAIDEAVDAEPTAQKTKEAIWPAFFALGQLPETPDLIGLRLSIPFSTKQDNVTGIELGLWSRTPTFEGLQISILRNNVEDQLSGFQIGLYNSAGQSDAFGVQVGLWNEALIMSGVQVGLINYTHTLNGLQVGLVNRTEEAYGFQIGVINVIRDAELRFCPFINIGF